MKCLFLDHFGVMCLSGKREEDIKYQNIEIKYLPEYGILINFDVNCIQILNDIIDKTDAEIIISSDWKHWCDFHTIKNFYKTQGIIKPPLCFTPIVNKQKTIIETRCLEIKTFLIENVVDKWCVVDDIYLGDYLNNFVWISKTNEGLCQKNIKNIIINFLK